ncbi:MAG: hypothetical protein K1X67_18900 [Fimbriimonadaceae bacterium]|nr:hypothetical protein [Fimbriimonadaceae bacterium]
MLGRRETLPCAVLLLCACLAGCSAAKSTESAPGVVASNAPAASTQAPAAAATLPPITTDAEFHQYVDYARQLLRRSCFDVYQALDAQCTVDAGASTSKLRELIQRLPADKAGTRAAASQTVDQLDHWWRDCQSTKSNTPARQACIPYMPRDAQLMSIEAAWTLDKPENK